MFTTNPLKKAETTLSQLADEAQKLARATAGLDREKTELDQLEGTVDVTDELALKSITDKRRAFEEKLALLNRRAQSNAAAELRAKEELQAARLSASEERTAALLEQLRVADAECEAAVEQARAAVGEKVASVQKAAQALNREVAELGRLGKKATSSASSDWLHLNPRDPLPEAAKVIEQIRFRRSMASGARG